MIGVVRHQFTQLFAAALFSLVIATDDGSSQLIGTGKACQTDQFREMMVFRRICLWGLGHYNQLVFWKIRNDSCIHPMGRAHYLAFHASFWPGCWQ